MKYTQIPANTFKNLQMNAGILAENFNPTTGAVSGLIGATTGGIQFTDSIEYNDLGEDIDNCPKNMKELKVLNSHEVTMSGTFVSVSADTAKLLVGAGDASGNAIVPRNDLDVSDFKDIWWIGDYSDVNTGEEAGFMAIKLHNALNTGGFQIQSTDKAKGQFAFTFMGHYSMSDPDEVPYAIYMKGGDATPSILLDAHSITLTVGQTRTLHATVAPSGQTVSWSSGTQSKATVNSSGLVTAAAAGNSIITAAITVDGVTYNDTCTVVVVAAG